MQDIITEIEQKKISCTITYFPEYALISKAKWNISMKARNAEGDTISVARKNTDFEAAFIAAYQAVRTAMNERLNRALPAPTKDEIQF